MESNSSPTAQEKRKMMTKTDTKIGKVLKHLQSGRSITQREAILLFDYYRLSSGIYRLKRRGHCIGKAMIRPKGKSSYARYSLVKKGYTDETGV